MANESTARESTARTLTVAFVICAVCSLLVAVPTVALKPMQEEQKLLDKQKAVLSAANLVDSAAGKKQIQDAFSTLDVRLVNLASGEFVEGDARRYNLSTELKSDKSSRALSSEEDAAGIKRQENVAPVYLKRSADGKLDAVVIPVRGYGLWSTLYGFLALKGDANTVEGLVFYQHAETPGLGGEVDNPKWRALWPGKQVLDASGKLSITVIKGNVDAHDPLAVHKVDGLAGATLTARGVDALIKFWLSDQAFGPFLSRVRSQGV